MPQRRNDRVEALQRLESKQKQKPTDEPEPGQGPDREPGQGPAAEPAEAEGPEQDLDWGAGQEPEPSQDPGQEPGRDSNQGREPAPARKPAPARRPGAKPGPARKRKPKPTGPRRWPLVAVLSILAVGAVLAGLFCWQKWWRFDDAMDIQGEWKVAATGDTIVIDNRDLKLTKSISYEYRLDTGEKTISFSFGQMEGGGRYYFNVERDVLVIIDGDEQLGVLAELGFLPGDLLENDTVSDAVTVLQRVSDDTTAEPSGNGNGISNGSNRGEREFVVKPEPSSSSSSQTGSRSSSSAASSSSSRQEDDGLPEDDGLASGGELPDADELSDGYDGPYGYADADAYNGAADSPYDGTGYYGYGEDAYE